MAIYMISYDLRSPTTNRESVEKDIKSIGKCRKFLTTTYLLSTLIGHEAVTNIAIRSLDGNDRMFVCKVEKPIFGWFTKEERQWIESNL